MPVLASSKKALRRDQRRTIVNRRIRNRVKGALDAIKNSATTATLSAGFSALDRAAKKHVIHKNKAARLKSRLARKIAAPVTTPKTKEPVKKVVRKSTSKKIAKK